MTADEKKNEYLERLRDLYSNIKRWLPEDFSVKQEQVELNEELSGLYSAPALEILDKLGKEIAMLRPVGAWIIAAEGLVELSGKFGRERFAYLNTGGPSFFVTEIVGNKKTKVQKPLFKNVTSAGWYWIEDARKSKAAPVDEELFKNLASEVSNYAF